MNKDNSPGINLPNESLPWPDVIEKGSCADCRNLEDSTCRSRAVPKGGTINDELHVCPTCGRRWWQFNVHFHLWQNILQEGKWNIFVANLTKYGTTQPQDEGRRKFYMSAKLV